MSSPGFLSSSVSLRRPIFLSALVRMREEAGTGLPARLIHSRGAGFCGRGVKWSERGSLTAGIIRAFPMWGPKRLVRGLHTLLRPCLLFAVCPLSRPPMHRPPPVAWALSCGAHRLESSPLWGAGFLKGHRCSAVQDLGAVGLIGVHKAWGKVAVSVLNAALVLDTRPSFFL